MSDTETIETETFDEEWDVDVSEIADELDIEEDFIRSVKEAREMDEKYKKYQIIQDKNDDMDNKRFQKIKTFLRFIGNSIYYSPSSVPTKGKVEKAEIDDNTITITVKVPYPEVPGENADTDFMEKQVSFNLESKRDRENLDFLVKKAGVNVPSQIQDEYIPITNHNNKSRFRMSDPYFEIPTKPRSISDKVKYYKNRLTHLNLIDRNAYNYRGNKNNMGKWSYNRNILYTASLFLFIMSQVLSVSVNLLGLYFPKVFINLIFLSSISVLSLHIFIFTLTIVYGLLDFITHEPGNRDYIHKFINK